MFGVSAQKRLPGRIYVGIAVLRELFAQRRLGGGEMTAIMFGVYVILAGLLVAVIADNLIGRK